jgi:2'-5' RNA ligase
MPFALALALDDVAAATVRNLWDELAAAGFTFPATSGANPHVSLAIWDTIDPAATERALVAFATATAPVDVSFVRVDAFASSGTVFLAPEVDGRLLEVHARCHRHFAGVGAGAWPYYAPGVWVPHCTLAQDLDAAGVDSALAISQRARLPLRGRLERAELVEFRPVRRLAAALFPMSSSSRPT